MHLILSGLVLWLLLLTFSCFEGNWSHIGFYLIFMLVTLTKFSFVVIIMVCSHVYIACKYYGPFRVADMSKEGNYYSTLLFEPCSASEWSQAFNFVCGLMQDLSTSWLQCDPGPLFRPEYYTIPKWFPEWVSRLLSIIALHGFPMIWLYTFIAFCTMLILEVEMSFVSWFLEWMRSILKSIHSVGLWVSLASCKKPAWVVLSCMFKRFEQLVCKKESCENIQNLRDLALNLKKC